MNHTPRRVKERRQLILTLILAILIPLIDAIWGLTAGTVGGPVFEEELHLIGRILGALHFTSVYTCIMVRLLISTHYRSRVILLPALALLVIIGAAATGFFVHFRDQETIPLGVMTLDGFSLRQIGSGVISMIPAMGIVMILSPILIPSTYLQRIGELFGKDVRTGHGAFDEYLSIKKKKKARRQNKKEVIPAEFLPKPTNPLPQPDINVMTPPPPEDHPPDVLLVEDDLNCATLVLKFCKKINLDCHHVEDLRSAKSAYGKFKNHLRLLILDNFVRVGEGHQEGDAKTGSEWAKEINEEFEGKKRPFHMAILSGHTHLLKELADEADLVLQKPWEPQALFRYLKDNDVV